MFYRLLICIFVVQHAEMDTVLNYSLHEVEPYINWLYFFNTWGLPPRMGAVAQQHDCPSCRAAWLSSFPESEQGKAKEAARLYDDALAMLHQMDGEIQTHALVGLYDANSRQDDIVVHRSKKSEDDFILPMLRQQHGEQCLSWADFLRLEESGVKDTIGIFVTSVDEKMEHSFPNDDYQHLLCQTLADRLAEATAERMHKQVRTTLWGYAPDEKLTPAELFQEKYTGKRPAVGYPSLPDQSLNFLIDQLMGMQRIGVSLTPSGAMQPHASTSGLIFAHPAATHFAIGPIDDGQLQDYAHRRGLTPEELRPFLAANLTH